MLCCPYRTPAGGCAQLPKALPWAVIFNPFRVIALVFSG
jgi:hypothetical protein